MDQDCRAGHLQTKLRFGPNALDGLVDESVVEGYVVFLVQATCSAGSDEQGALSEPLAFIPKAMQEDNNTSADQCGCQKERYSASVEVEFPVSMEAVKFMIVPNTTAGLLPIGVTTDAVPDVRVCSTTTTTATTTITSTTVTTSSSETLTSSTTTTTFRASSTTTTTLRADQQKIVSGSLTLQVSSPEKFVKDPAAATAVRVAVASLAGVPSSAVQVSLSLGQRRLADAAEARRLQDVPPVVVAYTILLDAQVLGRPPASVVQSLTQATVETASAALVAAVRATPGAGSYYVSVLEVGEPEETIVTPGDQKKVLVGSLTLQVSTPEKFVKDAAAATAVRAAVASLAGVPSSAVTVSLSLGFRRLADAAEARRLQDVPPVVVAYTIPLDAQVLGRPPASVVQSMTQATVQTASAALVAAVRATPGAGSYYVSVLEVGVPEEQVVTPGDQKKVLVGSLTLQVSTPEKFVKDAAAATAVRAAVASLAGVPSSAVTVSLSLGFRRLADASEARRLQDVPPVLVAYTILLDAQVLGRPPASVVQSMTQATVQTASAALVAAVRATPGAGSYYVSVLEVGAPEEQVVTPGDQKKVLVGSLTLQVSTPEKFVKDAAAATAVRAAVASLAGVPSSAVTVSLSLGFRRLGAAVVARQLQDVPPVVAAYTIPLDAQVLGRPPASVVQSMTQATVETASAALVAAVRATPGAGSYYVTVLEVGAPQEQVVVTPGDGGSDPTDQPVSVSSSSGDKSRDKSVDVAVGCVGAAAAVGVLAIVLYICYERHMAAVRRSKANVTPAGQMEDAAAEQVHMPFKPIYGPGDPPAGAGDAADLDTWKILEDEDIKPFRLQLPTPVLGLPKERKVVVPTKGGKGSKKPLMAVQESDDPNMIWDTKNLGDQAPTNVHPAIHNREPVEYFSAPHGRFMPGVMEVAFSAPLPNPSAEASPKKGVKASAPPESPRVMYTVQLLVGEGKDPMRVSDVPLHSFRMPLAEGELVEVFSRSRGQWVRAVTDGSQEHSGTEGYTVKLADNGEIYKGVPPSRVRRLFPEGCPVMVYKGTSRGWAPALVDPVSVPLADWDGKPLDAPPWPRLDLGTIVAPVGSDRSALGPKLEGRPPRENSPPPPGGARRPAAGGAAGPEEQPEPWCMVPIREMDSTTGKLVPSYLVHPVVESSNPFRAPLAADMLPWPEQEPGDNRSRL